MKCSAKEGKFPAKEGKCYEMVSKREKMLFNVQQKWENDLLCSAKEGNIMKCSAKEGKCS